jgi:hypothetical protein
MGKKGIEERGLYREQKGFNQDRKKFLSSFLEKNLRSIQILVGTCFPKPSLIVLADF